MHPDTYWFKTILKKKDLIEKIKQIKLVVTDVDGCITNGTVYVTEDDNEHKGFSIQDGFATAHGQKAGLAIAFLSGRASKATEIRAQKLKIPENLCYTGKNNGKIKTLKIIQNDVKTTKKETLFFGDDIFDAQTKDYVGIFASPANAVFYVQHIADIVIPKNGGGGSFRLLLDLILYSQQKHFAQELIDRSLGL